jgi:transposase
MGRYCQSNNMMGQHHEQNQLFSYSVNLERRVRRDHPLRAVRQALGDLAWVRPAVAHTYGANGHVSADPVLLVKMMVLLFLDDVPSERELMDVIAERLDYLWFLGLGLDDDIPHHSVLSKARARWGAALFEDLFVRSIGLCVQAGLVEGGKLHLDSSLIRAHAARDSVVTGSPELLQALRAAARQQEQKLEEKPVEGVNATHVSGTDPEATLARHRRSQASELSYKHHRAVDDAHGVITAVETTTGTVSDPSQLQPLVQQHQEHTGQKVTTVIGDGHYGTATNYRQGQAQDQQTHLKSYQAAPSSLYPASQFTYEAEQDRFRCPQGRYLYYHNFKKSDQLIEYRIEKASQCAACPVRPHCTHATAGRTLSRPIFTELVRLGQSQAGSAAAKKDLGRRRHLMEGSFADAANNHGFKQARWRGLMRQKIQNWIIAAVQNIRIWMGKRGPGTRTAGQNRVLFRLWNLKRPHWFHIGEFLGLTRFSPGFSTNLGWTRVRSFGQHALTSSPTFLTVAKKFSLKITL